MNSSKEVLIKIEDVNDREKTEINILCFDITPYSPFIQFLCCSTFVFICYLAYGYFLELIFSAPEVKPVSLYITCIQFIITTILSYVEALIRNPIKRKVPLRTYALLAALTLGTMSFSNLALSYLNYPTQLIFKSCKLIPVMIGSVIILGKRYNFLDYVAAIIMCIGLTMFTLADAKTSPNFDVVGVLVISLALLCDAIIGNVQEKAMKQFQATNNEVVFYSYAIASVYLVLITGLSGIFRDGVMYCSKDYQTMYTNIFLLSVSGYLGLQAVLSLVRLCGAAVAVTVTTARKALSIAVSFLLFSKPFVFHDVPDIRIHGYPRKRNIRIRKFLGGSLMDFLPYSTAFTVTTARKALSNAVSFLLFSKPFVFQYAWSGLLVVLAIYLNHYSKTHRGYIPWPLQQFWGFVQGFYQSEYRYLKMKTKLYADTV